MNDREQIARLRISLKEIEPEIWRRVDVPLGLNLKGLHDVIQAVMGWQDYHLFEFRVGDKLYGVPAPEDDYGRKVLHAKLAKIDTLVARGISRFDYVYDFGDDWEHLIEIETIAEGDPSTKYPRFVEGARRGPPEDVGGIPGYCNFVAAIIDPRHRDHREVLEWYGRPYDPDDIDSFDLRLRLGAIAKRRSAGKAAFKRRQRVI
jgi:hypothetical protein